MIKTIAWQDDKIILIDQTKLPQEEKYITCTKYSEVAEAIYKMNIRGAPAIGVAGAMGIAQGAQMIDAQTFDDFFSKKSGQVAERGHGLGLAISRRIIEIHNGSITAESKPGQGSVFVISLPKCEDDSSD